MKQWAKERWKELRWGTGVYLAAIITFFNLILLLRLNFGLSNIEAVLLFFGLSGLAVVIGHLHRNIQQDTDALLENKAVIEEIVRRVKEEK